jgi:hypothetical protein
MNHRYYLIVISSLLLLTSSPSYAALSSNNLPLDSPAYHYLDKLAGLGLFSSDFRGIRPITKSEAARLLQEAESNRGKLSSQFADELIAELRSYLSRESAILENKVAVPGFEVKPLAEAKLRYVYLDGVPRNYEREVHDPGNEGVFGIGSGLRPENSSTAIANQKGTEGTPLLENNEGIRYAEGSNLDIRLRSEMYLSGHTSLFLEPMFLSSDGILQGRVNKGYLKLGGGGLELEVGRDENWLGFGERGAITLSNNAANFDLIKLSSPEPIDAGFLGMMKYALIFSRFDSTMTPNGERQPYFYAIKASLKPVPSFEIGLNLGRQQGGKGVDNSLRSNLQGLVGGTSKDNSNSLGGLELRWRISSLRNTEAYLEFSGEDAAKFWPIVESYLAGIFIPMLTKDGKNDFRFEYFLGNRILYTHGQFTEGYMYKGMPIGHSQGGATQDFFCRYQHWFSARNRVGLDYFYTTRGNLGRVAGQALERKNSVRGSWKLPVGAKLDLQLLYGWEKVKNLDLVGGVDRINNLATAELAYRF